MQKLLVCAFFVTFSAFFPAGCAYVPLPENSCPSIFSYHQHFGPIFGQILVPYDDTFKNFRLIVFASMDSVYGSDQKQMEITLECAKIISGRKFLKFNLHFPNQFCIPRITKIEVNGDTLCDGPQGKQSENTWATFYMSEHNIQKLYWLKYTNIWNIFAHNKETVINTSGDIMERQDHILNRLPENNYYYYPMDKPKVKSQMNFMNYKPMTTNYPEYSILMKEKKYPENPVFMTGTDMQITNSRPYSDICGQSQRSIDLIVQGTSVEKGAYPWLTAIYMQANTDLKYICSGSLVSNKHIVTASHCLVKSDNAKIRASDILVVLGKINIAVWPVSPGEHIILAESTHVHPDFDRTSDADIGIIVMSEAVKFSPLIKPICLWNGPTDLGNNQFGVVAGWGKDEFGKMSSVEPKQTKLPIVSQDTCLRSSPVFNFITSNRTFCAGFLNGTGPCTGDSGAGFIAMSGSRPALRGIVSMSIAKAGMCDLTEYVVFTDASKFVDWILSFIQ